MKQTRSREIVIFIDRSEENILQTRTELVHDPKLAQRIDYYRQLSKQSGWRVVDNNTTLESAKQQISSILGIQD